jgi:hypothetical protein
MNSASVSSSLSTASIAVLSLLSSMKLPPSVAYHNNTVNMSKLAQKLQMLPKHCKKISKKAAQPLFSPFLRGRLRWPFQIFWSPNMIYGPLVQHVQTKVGPV